MSEKWTVNEMDQNIHKAANIRAEKDGLPDVIAAHRNAIESCAAGPWQYPPAEPPHCDLLIESQNTPKLFYAVLWSTEHNYWNYSNGERIKFEIHTSWKRWAVINEETKP